MTFAKELRVVDIRFLFGSVSLFLVLILLPETPLVNPLLMSNSGLRFVVLSFEVIFSLYVLFFVFRGEEEVLKSPYLKMLIMVWFVWTLLSVYSTHHVDVSIFRLVEVYVAVAFLYSMYFFYRQYTSLALITRNVLIIGFVLYTLLLLIVWGLLDSWNSTFYYQKLFFGFGHVRHFGYYALVMLVISCGLLWRAIYNGQSLLIAAYFTSAVAAWAWLFAIGGRGPFFAFIVSTVATALVNRRYFTKRFVAALVASLAIGLAISVPVSPDVYGPARLLSTLTESTTLNEFSSSRLEIWRDALTLILNHPYFGIGPDGYLYELSRKYVTTLHPHGIVPQIFLDWGIPGALLFLTVVIMLFIELSRRVSKLHGEECDRTGMYWAVLAIATFSLIDGVLYFPRPVLIFLVLSSILFASLHKKPVEGHCPYCRPVAVLILLFSALVAALHLDSLLSVTAGPVTKLESERVRTLQRFPSILADPAVNHTLALWSTELEQTTSLEQLIGWYQWLESHSSQPWLFAYLHAETLYENDRSDEADELLSEYREYSPESFVYRFDCLQERYKK